MADDNGDMKVVDRRWWARGEDAPGTEWTPGKPSYVEELERQLAEKNREIQDLLAKYREAAGEMDGMRARLRRDVARDAERSRRSMIADLLEVLDNLDRALDAAGRSPDPSAIVAGVDLVRAQFLQKLEGLGVRRMASVGEPFDPERHEAVSTVPAADPSQDGTIIGVVAHGYTIGDEVLRPALVAVAQR